MTIITYICYAIAILFLFLLTRAIIRVVRTRQALKPKKNYEKQTKKLRAQGFKPFKFNKGKTEIWAKSLKEAQQQFNANRKTSSKTSKS